MVWKSKQESEPEKPVQEPKISAPQPAKSSGSKTVIGEHISIQGDIEGREDLIIQGSVKGSIKLDEHHVTVGEKGHLEAEIHADNVTISGKLAGNIQAKGKVAITRDADFTGEIKAGRISVEDGAYLKAVIELERKPVKEAASPLKPAVAQTPPAAQKPLAPATGDNKPK